MPNIDKINYKGTEYDLTPADYDSKANVDGYYETFTSGQTEQIIATEAITDTEPYNYRKTCGANDVGDRVYDTLVGGSVVWNQLIKNGNFASTSGLTAVYGTLSVSNNVGEYTVTDIGSTQYDNRIVTTSSAFDNSDLVSGHKFLYTVSIKPAHTKDAYLYLIRTDSGSNISVRKSVTANVWNDLSTVISTVAETKYVYLQLGMNCTSANGYEVGDKDYLKNYMLIDLTALIGSTIADYIYNLEQATPGSGVDWFKKYFPEVYYGFAEPHFEHVQVSAKNTVGFNQFDKDNANKLVSCYINNGKIDLAGGRMVVYIPCFPNTTYCASRKAVQTSERFVIAWAKELPAYGVDVYNPVQAPTSQTVGNTMTITTTTGADAKYIVLWAYWDSHIEALDTLCINISGSRNGEYEPYKKRTYPLDALTLRGIPKLDASNRLYFDGDIYEHDGTVTRRYGIVDLGTLNYTYITSSTYPFFRASPSGQKLGSGIGAICIGYDMQTGHYGSLTEDKMMCSYSTSVGTIPYICFRNDAYTDAASFKAAMSGVYLLYELNTPEPFAAEPFQSPMVVDPLGTEEFVDYGVEQGDRDVAIPVGHNSEYPADLRGKLQHLPSLASADGRYCVQQSGKQMSLVADTSPGRLNVLENKIPDPPTTEGNYQLTCSINSIGSPAFSWVAVASE